MISDLMAAWSAALAVWLAGAFCLSVLRLFDVWESNGIRVKLLLIGTIFLCSALAYGNAVQLWAWSKDILSWSDLALHFAIRKTGVTIGVFILAGAASYPRCKHRGWITLLIIGLFVGVITFFAVGGCPIVCTN